MQRSRRDGLDAGQHAVGDADTLGVAPQVVHPDLEGRLRADRMDLQRRLSADDALGGAYGAFGHRPVFTVRRVGQVVEASTCALELVPACITRVSVTVGSPCSVRSRARSGAGLRARRSTCCS